MMNGMTERDRPVYDTLLGFLGFIAWPFVRSSWRKMVRDIKEEHSKRELPAWP
jgi:hypothetical protein